MPDEKKRSTGYHGGSVDAVMSVEAVSQQATAIAEHVSFADIMALADNNPYLVIEDPSRRFMGGWKFCTGSTWPWRANSRCA